MQPAQRPPEQAPLNPVNCQGGGDRSKQPVICWLCQDPGHFSRNCPKNPNRQQYTRQGPRSPMTSHVAAGGRRKPKMRQAAYLRAKVGEQERECLLDSGSEVSILPASVVGSTPLRPTTQTLTAANGTKIPLLGEATVPFSTGSYSSTVAGLVSEHISEVMSE